jgi:large subunit ribosomal protein L2
MGIRAYQPVTPSLRFRTVSDFEGLTKSRPPKTLLSPLRSSGGRNAHGHITSRHRGGGHKRAYRIVDFKREKHGIAAVVKGIEYDPNRSARIALLFYADGEQRYILSPHGLRAGQSVISGPGSEVKAGNALPLVEIPVGSDIHAIELHPGKGAQLVRSAGGIAQLMAKEGNFAHVRLSSGEIRLVRLACQATIGQVSNPDHENVSLGKAGAMRWLGVRPQSRGVVMNPHDHPMGGGEGKSSGGRHPCSPWGKLSKGMKTRSPKSSNHLIIRRRK